MKRELDAALVKDFPLLYADRGSSAQETLMCFGFPGDGWEPLIRDLSEKLEPIIQKYIDETPNLRCRCGCEKNFHYKGRCRNRWLVPYQIGFLRTGKLTLWDKIINNLNRALMLFASKFVFLNRREKCFCDKYSPDHPRASQVKEKFGTLSFYLSHGTDEMFDLVEEAERASDTICEGCGATGKLRKGGWLLTLCDGCNSKR